VLVAHKIEQNLRHLAKQYEYSEDGEGMHATREQFNWGVKNVHKTYR
jgi:hypothetical protein